MCVLRINQQQQQQQHQSHHHHSHHNPQYHQQQQQHQNPNTGKGMSSGMVFKGSGDAAATASSHGTGMYAQKVSQFRKYNGPSAINTTTNMTRNADSKPKVVAMQAVVDTNHIPTVSANGIPGAAETTVSSQRTMTSTTTGSVPNGTILSSEEKGSGLDGMLGKEKTAMCLVNELSRYNKVSDRRSRKWRLFFKLHL